MSDILKAYILDAALQRLHTDVQHVHIVLYDCVKKLHIALVAVCMFSCSDSVCMHSVH